MQHVRERVVQGWRSSCNLCARSTSACDGCAAFRRHWDACRSRRCVLRQESGDGSAPIRSLQRCVARIGIESALLMTRCKWPLQHHSGDFGPRSVPKANCYAATKMGTRAVLDKEVLSNFNHALWDWDGDVLVFQSRHGQV